MNGHRQQLNPRFLGPSQVILVHSQGRNLCILGTPLVTSIQVFSRHGLKGVHDQGKLFQHSNIENVENAFSSIIACDPQIHRLSRSRKIQFL